VLCFTVDLTKPGIVDSYANAIYAVNSSHIGNEKEYGEQVPIPFQTPGLYSGFPAGSKS